MIKTLEEILKDISRKGECIFIPSYQRGYRWTPLEVRQLLDDLLACKRDGGYFLQLLAVREAVQEDEKERPLRIIDGQQRLTTAMLILESLGVDEAKGIKIKYETRNKGFDNGCGESDAKVSGLDAYYIDEAKRSIKGWLDEHDAAENEVIKSRLKSSEFLYVTVEEKEELDFFTRINTWKIEATDSELVKCFFLSPDNSGEKPDDIQRRAIEWNVMERKLSDNSFWGFMADANAISGDRMAKLFTYAGLWDKDIRGEEKFPLYESVRKRSKQEEKTKLWEQVKRGFSLLEYWYNHRAIRHLVGWYVHSGQSIYSSSSLLSIVDCAKSLFDPDTTNGAWLKEKDLYQTGDKEKIKKYLLLANVAWCSMRAGIDYDFYRHALIPMWSIEHVHARNQQKLNEVDFKELKFKDGVNVDDLWNNYNKIENKDEAQKCLEEQLTNDSGYPEEDEDNSLRNLALLPKDANSRLNDKLFSGKQREILSWATAGVASSYWAPPLTAAMFTKEVGDPNDKFKRFWSIPDREKCVAEIRSIIIEFLEECGNAHAQGGC